MVYSMTEDTMQLTRVQTFLNSRETPVAGDTMTSKVTNDAGSVSFRCPNCGKTEIVRTKKERLTAVGYKCPECGFEGPN
jgi:Zn-ribbon RNA-binding protein